MENINLKKYTTFKIGGEPKNFFIVKNNEELINIIYKLEGKFFILGGGSNLLVSDNIKDYTVVKIENRGIEIESNILKVEAGENFQLIINTAINNNLSGLEWGSGIPGTIGGVIFGNSGSFGGEIKDSLENVEVFDLESKTKNIFSNKECNFSYRSSIFKENKNRYIILRAVFKLKKVNNNSEIKNIYNKNLEIKKNTQPIGKFSAGCVFKNVVYDFNNLKLTSFMDNYSEKDIFIQKKQIPTAFLIDKFGLKGLNVGDAEISKIHANFIVNNGNASYNDVKKLINIIKEKCFNVIGVELEEEIEEI